MGNPQRKKLDRTLKPHWVWAIAFGSAVGWGAFVLPTDWMSDKGPLAVVIGLILGAILMTIIGVSYGFLIKHFPVSGGEFAYAYIGFGRTNAFIAGWFLTLGYICIVALNASALALLGKFLFPSIVKVGYLYTIAGWDVYFSNDFDYSKHSALARVNPASSSDQLQLGYRRCYRRFTRSCRCIRHRNRTYDGDFHRTKRFLYLF